MSESREPRPDPDSNGAPNGVCPFLGWHADAETHHAYPSAANQCHTQSPPLSIELAYQASTCLEGEWAACPRFKATREEGVVQKPAAIPWIGRSNAQGRRLPFWAILGIVVAALALLGGLVVLLGPVTGLTGSDTPTRVAAATSSPAPAVAATGHATETSEAAAPATESPEPTSTPKPTQTSAPTLTPSPTATSTPTATPSPAPTETVMASATPGRGTATAASTSGAGGTATATATTPPTATPTATATPTLEPTATRAPTNTPRPTARPTNPPPPAPTPTKPAAGPQFPAPMLVSPNSGQVFSARDSIILRWQPVGQLAADEYYVPTVAYLRFGDTWYDDTPWSKEPSWDLSSHRYLLELSDDGEFRWAVRVMRRTGINNEGKPEGTARSPLSEVRTLEWKRAGGGGGGDGGGTPEPPPP